MSYMQIPLTNDPDQNFTCTIPVDGKNLKLKLRVCFNTAMNYWIMSITNSTTNALILDAIPLLTGVDLLGQYKYLGLGSSAIINKGNSTLDSPNSKTLGTDFVLIWGDS